MKNKRKIWVTADQHYGHDNIIKYCDRPFTDCEHMDYEIAKNYNSVVRPQDLCYFLGDVGMKDSLVNIIPKLNGTKVLILGNHDTLSVGKYMDMGFSAVLYSLNLRIGKKRVHLRHVPTRTFMQFLSLCVVWARDMRKRKNPWISVWYRIRREFRNHKVPDKSIVLSGHVHTAWKTRGNNVNVGVDVRNFKPVKLYDAITELDRR